MTRCILPPYGSLFRTEWRKNAAGPAVSLGDVTGDSILHEIIARGHGFGHRQHLELTWRCLEHNDPETALAIVAGAIRRIAAEHGAPDKYHATLTGGWVHCVAVHRERRPAASFDAFIARNPELLDPKLLEHFYSSSLLFSDAARAAVTGPDRRPLPALTA